jgi:hypothetical protein
MTTHLRYDNQTRTETDETVIATLIRKGWEAYTPDPVVEVPTVYNADEWVNAQGFNDKRPTTLLYLKLKLDAVQLVSPKLAAVQGWLDTMIIAGVTTPEEKRSDWPVSPHLFEEASGEALAILSSPNPET